MSATNFDVCTITLDVTDGRWVLWCYGFKKGSYATREEAIEAKRITNKYESQFSNP